MSWLVYSMYNHVCSLRERLKRRFRRGSLPFRILRPFSQLVEKVFPVYRRLTGDGVFYREGELSMSSLSCPRILAATLELLRPKSVLDLGCGTGVSLDWFTTRERPEREVLPWDHLDSGLDRDWLWSDWQDALRASELDDCRWTPCYDCGVCPTMGSQIEIGPTRRRLLPLTPVAPLAERAPRGAERTPEGKVQAGAAATS